MSQWITTIDKYHQCMEVFLIWKHAACLPNVNMVTKQIMEKIRIFKYDKKANMDLK